MVPEGANPSLETKTAPCFLTIQDKSAEQAWSVPCGHIRTSSCVPTSGVGICLMLVFHCACNCQIECCFQNLRFEREIFDVIAFHPVRHGSEINLYSRINEMRETRDGHVITIPARAEPSIGTRILLYIKQPPLAKSLEYGRRLIWRDCQPPPSHLHSCQGAILI